MWMRVLITGGTGLIGRALTRRLVDRGDDVTVLSRDPRRATGMPPATRVAQWDAKTGEAGHHLVTADTAIVSLAGESIAAGRWTSERKKRILDSRVQSGEAVVDAVQRGRVAPQS